jgi:hypothetical protein
MRINNIRVPHLGQDGQAMKCGEIAVSSILRLPRCLAERCTEIFWQVE